MIKSKKMKLFSVLFMLVIILLVVSAFGIAAKKEKVHEWISAADGGEISLRDVTIYFGPGILTKDTKIQIMYFGNGEYKFGPEIKVNGEFTVYFADAPSGETVVMTFKQGEWVELECINGYVETNHFSRYRGAW